VSQEKEVIGSLYEMLLQNIHQTIYSSKICIYPLDTPFSIYILYCSCLPKQFHPPKQLLWSWIKVLSMTQEKFYWQKSQNTNHMC